MFPPFDTIQGAVLLYSWCRSLLKRLLSSLPKEALGFSPLLGASFLFGSTCAIMSTVGNIIMTSCLVLGLLTIGFVMGALMYGRFYE